MSNRNLGGPALVGRDAHLADAVPVVVPFPADTSNLAGFLAGRKVPGLPGPLPGSLPGYFRWSGADYPVCPVKIPIAVQYGDDQKNYPPIGRNLFFSELSIRGYGFTG